MNLLNKITIKNLRLNKKRTIVTIIGITLSVALICAVASMYNSGVYSLINYEKQIQGNFHYAYYNVPIENVNDFKNNRKIDEIYYFEEIGYAKIKESRNEYKPYAFIGAMDKESLSNLSLKLVEGRMPENDGEIIIPTHLRTNGLVEYKVGDTVTLSVGTRIGNGKKLTQKDRLEKEIPEEIINTKDITYKIVGLVERPSKMVEAYSSPGFTFITYKEKMTNTVSLFVRYNEESLKNHPKINANILGVDEKLFTKYYMGGMLTESESLKLTKEIEKAKYSFDINSYLIILEMDPLNNNVIGSLGNVVLIVCLIIVIASIFCIKNSFDISITEKIRQYGMLRSVGATKKQIKKNVFYEAFILGLFGIPLGIIFGLLASFILVIVSNYYLSDSIGLILEFKISFIAIIFSVILGCLTIYLSSLRSAIKASRISPIDAIRSSQDIKTNKKKIKTSKLIYKFFGISGEISKKNIKRNKRKYRTTVISIVVSVTIFIALSSFVHLAYSTADDELRDKDYNIRVSIFTNNNHDVYKKVIETTKYDSINNYSLERNTGLEIKKPKFSNDYEKINAAAEYSSSTEYLSIIGLEGDSFKKYLAKVGINESNLIYNAILVDRLMYNYYDTEKEKLNTYNIRVFDYQVGDKIVFDNNNKELDVTVGYVTDIRPFAHKSNSQTLLVVNGDVYNSLMQTLFDTDDSNYLLYINSSNPNKLQNDIEKLLQGETVNVYNISESVNRMNNLFTLITIFLYGFIIVISLIGVTNIINTITTNMYLRRREFAMLKSIGMTKKELKKMIRLESIFICFRALLFGIILGSVLAYFIQYYFHDGTKFHYVLPIQAIIISIILVYLLINVIMHYSINRINKENVIETIRNENI